MTLFAVGRLNTVYIFSNAGKLFQIWTAICLLITRGWHSRPKLSSCNLTNSDSKIVLISQAIPLVKVNLVTYVIFLLTFSKNVLILRFKMLNKNQFGFRFEIFEWYTIGGFCQKVRCAQWHHNNWSSGSLRHTNKTNASRRSVWTLSFKTKSLHISCNQKETKVKEWKKREVTICDPQKIKRQFLLGEELLPVHSEVVEARFKEDKPGILRLNKNGYVNTSGRREDQIQREGRVWSESTFKRRVKCIMPPANQMTADICKSKQMKLAQTVGKPCLPRKKVK